MTRRILILIGGHLCTAPRVQKEAAFLAEQGYQICVAGVWYDDRLASWDRAIIQSSKYDYQAALDMRPGVLFPRFRARLTRKAAHLLAQHAGIQTDGALGYGLPALERSIRQHRPSLVIAHAEGSLALVCRLVGTSIPFAVDFEDWFSEDLPVDAQRGRGQFLLTRYEQVALSHAAFTMCPTRAMASAMEARYGGTRPLTVYNSFSVQASPMNETGSSSVLQLVWFSQTVGSGRGLESLFEALGKANFPFSLTVIGSATSSERQRLLSILPADRHNRITFLPLVPPWELPGVLTGYDIGLALEENRIVSTDLTCSNKVFQYLAAGCAVIATRTTGQQEIWPDLQHPGSLIQCGAAQELLAALTLYAHDRNALRQAKENAHTLARSFEPEITSKSVIQQAVARVLGV